MYRKDIKDPLPFFSIKNLELMKNDLEEIKFGLRSKFRIIEKLRYILQLSRRDKFSVRSNGEDKTEDDQSEVREARRKA